MSDTPTPETPSEPPKRRKKTGRPSKFTPEARAAILGAIRAGTWAHVAAGEAGITFTTFKRWMNDKRKRFRAFRAEVDQARCAARGVMERAVWKGDPISWLRLGPGRDKGPDEPGWTESTKIDLRGQVNVTGGVETSLVLQDPETTKLAIELEERLQRLEAEKEKKAP